MFLNVYNILNFETHYQNKDILLNEKVLLFPQSAEHLNRVRITETLYSFTESRIKQAMKNKLSNGIGS